MKRNLSRGIAGVVLASLAIACSDEGRAPLAPALQAVPQQSAAPAAPAADTATSTVRVDGLQWRKPLRSDVSASALIGPAGGVLELPATGLRLVVPAGAVRQPTQFAATALAGKLVAYDFAPAGSKFPVPLSVEQDPSFVDQRFAAPSAALEAGYFARRSDLDETTGTGRVVELTAARQSSSTIAFPVWHFSGYIISWGRE